MPAEEMNRVYFPFIKLSARFVSERGFFRFLVGLSQIPPSVSCFENSNEVNAPLDVITLYMWIMFTKMSDIFRIV